MRSSSATAESRHCCSKQASVLLQHASKLTANQSRMRFLERNLEIHIAISVSSRRTTSHCCTLSTLQSCWLFTDCNATPVQQGPTGKTRGNWLLWRHTRSSRSVLIRRDAIQHRANIAQGERRESAMFDSSHTYSQRRGRTLSRCPPSG